MSLRTGIIGMPNVGKSTLFNAITNAGVLAENYPFATIEPNIGVVAVPDPRLDDLAQRFNSQKKIAATVEFCDIAGLVKGASQGEGLGNQFLAAIREVDAIVHVVRCFPSASVVHVEGSIGAVRDAEIINYELIMKDLETLTKRRQTSQKKASVSKDHDLKWIDALLAKTIAGLEAGQSARALALTPEEVHYLASELHLLTLKPVMYVANVASDELNQPETNEEFCALVELAKREGALVLPLAVQLEAEISLLDEADRPAFQAEFGLVERGLDALIKLVYRQLGLATYFTVGLPETRAWTFKVGMKAPECAGIIHTDFERGFIRAEIYHYDDLIACGSEAAVKEQGKWRLEGKEYRFQDGDIAHFRFAPTK